MDLGEINGVFSTQQIQNCMFMNSSCTRISPAQIQKIFFFIIFVPVSVTEVYKTKWEA